MLQPFLPPVPQPLQSSPIYRVAIVNTRSEKPGNFEMARPQHEIGVSEVEEVEYNQTG